MMGSSFKKFSAGLDGYQTAHSSIVIATHNGVCLAQALLEEQHTASERTADEIQEGGLEPYEGSGQGRTKLPRPMSTFNPTLRSMLIQGCH
jgi:hypothetical protein